MARKFYHFTQDERVRLEYLYLREGLSVIEIAKILNKNRSTIYRELRKGECYVKDSHWNEVKSYSAQKAEIKYRHNIKTHGRKNKLYRDKFLKVIIIDYIKHKKYSPRAALIILKEKYPKLQIDISYISIYRYIYSKKYNDLKESDLPYKRFRKRKRKADIIYIRARLYGKSIENRPKKILKRQEFGHWEMDTVVGPIGKSDKSFLVLTERKTRSELIFLLNKHTVKEVANTLDSIEQFFCTGCKKNKILFSDIFKTITVDNGVEFSDARLLEKSIYGDKRTTIYYCHPHASYERGSNENQNRFIRRFYPKGTNFDNISNEDIISMENFINKYPRKKLNWKNSNYFFIKEIKDIKINFNKLKRVS